MDTLFEAFTACSEATCGHSFAESLRSCVEFLEPEKALARYGTSALSAGASRVPDFQCYWIPTESVIHCTLHADGKDSHAFSSIIFEYFRYWDWSCTLSCPHRIQCQRLISYLVAVCGHSAVVLICEDVGSDSVVQVLAKAEIQIAEAFSWSQMLHFYTFLYISHVLSCFFSSQFKPWAKSELPLKRSICNACSCCAM